MFIYLDVLYRNYIQLSNDETISNSLSLSFFNIV